MAVTPTTTLRPRPVAATMSETVVGQSTPTLTASGPATGTAGTAITAANITSVLAASSGSNATGTITFKVFGPQATAPTTCTTGGTTVGTDHGHRQRHLQPVGRLHADGASVTTGGTRPTAATPTTTRRPRPVARRCPRRSVGQATPTLTATGPATGTAGTAITTSNITRSSRAAPRARTPTGTITFTVFGPQATAPTTCTTGGTTVGTATVDRQRHLHPSAGYTPTGAGNYWWYASYGGDANNSAATSTCGSTMSETDGGQGRPDGDGEPARRPARSGPPSRRRNITRCSPALLGPNADRHHHLHRLRAPGHRPDHLHHRGHHGGHRDHGRGQRHLPPVGRLHADGCG